MPGLRPGETDDIYGLTRVVVGSEEGDGDNQDVDLTDLGLDLEDEGQQDQQTQQTQDQQDQQDQTQGGDDTSGDTTEGDNKTGNSEDDSSGEQVQKTQGGEEDSQQVEGEGDGEQVDDVFAEVGKQTQKTQGDVDRRDYSQFPEEYQKALKQTSNEAFNLFKKVYGEFQAKEAKFKEVEAKSQSLYENPEGYRLNPEVKQALQQYQVSQDLENHYQQQIGLIKEGKPWTVYVAGDDGKLQARVINPEVTTDDEGNRVVKTAEEHLAYVNQELGIVANAKQQTQGRIDQIRQAHQQSAGKVVEFLQEKEAAMFPDYKELKADDKQFVEKFQQALPVAVRHNPLTGMMGKGLLFIKSQSQQIQDLKDQIAQLKGLKKEKNLAGPSTQKVTSGGTTDGNAPTLDDFESMGLPLS